MNGLGLMLTGAGAREEVELAVRAEAAGFELALEWEFFHRHAFVRLAAVAQATSRIRIGTGIANAFTRSPLLHATAALDLDELSGGRMVLGLGSATRRMNEEWWGVPFSAPAERMEELCALLRAAFAATHGDGFSFSGKHWRLRIPAFSRPNTVRAEIPLWVAAVNRGMVAAAGRAADGLLGHPLATRRWHREVTLPLLRTAAESAGRPAGACPLVPIVVTSIGADRAQARHDAKQQLGFYLSTELYHTILDLHDAREVGRACQAALRKGDLDAAAAALPDELLDEMAIAGTPDDAGESLARWHAVAPLIVLYSPNAGIPPERMRANYDAIFATFGKRAR
jgi:probable F420-dependent oxidoreductase